MSHYHHQRSYMDDLRRLIANSQHALDQPPPPSLREILTAYRTKGDGDRDMLLAMLSAKTAEDQRLASAVSLQRTMLDIFQATSLPPAEPSHSYARPSSSYHYPAQSPRPHEPLPPRDRDRDRDRRAPHHHRHRAASRSRSPPRVHAHPSSREAPAPHHALSEYPRKRHRPSHSPHLSHAAPYESSHPSEQFPPSPYSSSDRSDSAEYSPRSRASMTIGSLLSSGPSREPNGDIPPQDRD